MIASHAVGRAVETADTNGVLASFFGHTVTRGRAVLGAKNVSFNGVLPILHDRQPSGRTSC